MQLTDEQKLERLKELGTMMKYDMDNNDGKISYFMRFFSVGMLKGIGECNESWCEDCMVKEALGDTCEQFVEEAMKEAANSGEVICCAEVK